MNTLINTKRWHKYLCISNIFITLFSLFPLHQFTKWLFSGMPGRLICFLYLIWGRWSRKSPFSVSSSHFHDRNLEEGFRKPVTFVLSDNKLSKKDKTVSAHTLEYRRPRLVFFVFEYFTSNRPWMQIVGLLVCSKF